MVNKVKKNRDGSISKKDKNSPIITGKNLFPKSTRPVMIARSAPIADKNPIEAEYFPVRPIKYPPKDIDEQNRLADDMREWASKDTSFDIEEFPILRGLNPYRFYKVALTNEYFAESLQIAKYWISVRLKQNWREGKIPREYVTRFLHMYSPEIKADLIEKIQLTSQVQEKQMIEVHMNAFPSSPLVPEKKEKK